MYRYSLNIVLIAALSILFNHGYALSQDAASDMNTLKGLKGIGVSVGDIDADAAADGLDKDRIAAAIARKLKKAGIKVFTDLELRTVSGQPQLVVNINTLKQPGPIYIFTAALDLNQIVVLERNQGLTAVSPTWSVLTTGGSLPEDLSANVQASLNPMLDSFISDYKKANPK